MTKKIPDLLKSAAAEKALEANAKFKEASLRFAVRVKTLPKPKPTPSLRKPLSVLWFRARVLGVGLVLRRMALYALVGRRA